MKTCMLQVLLVVVMLAGLASCKRRAQQPAAPPENQPAAKPQGVPLPPPTRVTLNLSDATMEQAATAIAQQAGIAVRIGSGRTPLPEAWKRSVAYQCESKPFWEVIIDISRLFEALPAQEGTDFRNCVTLTPAPGGWGCPAQVAGPFLITVANMNWSRSADLSPDGVPGGRLIMLGLEVRREPGTPVFSLDGPIIERAVDNLGNEFETASKATVHQPALDQWMTYLVCRLTGNPNMGDRITMLKGHFLVGLCDRLERIEFADVRDSAGRTMTAGSIRATVREFKDIPGMPTFTIEFEGLDERARNWIVSHPPKLLDDKGAAYQPSGRQAPRGGVTFQFQYSHLMHDGSHRPVPSVLIVEVPTGLSEVTLPFEFRDIPLP